MDGDACGRHSSALHLHAPGFILAANNTAVTSHTRCILFDRSALCCVVVPCQAPLQGFHSCAPFGTSPVTEFATYWCCLHVQLVRAALLSRTDFHLSTVAFYFISCGWLRCSRLIKQKLCVVCLLGRQYSTDVISWLSLACWLASAAVWCVKHCV